MSAKAYKGGFTLLELLVVMAIVTFLLAIVPPLLGNVIDSTRIKSATRHLSSALITARNKAISSQQEVILAIDVNSHIYSLLDKKRKLSLPDNTSFVLTTAKSEQLSPSKGAFRFFADGSSTGGQIKLSHEPFEYFININWLTGKVSISP